MEVFRGPLRTVFSPSFLPSAYPLNYPLVPSHFIPFPSFFFLHVSLLAWKHSYVSFLLLICSWSSSFIALLPLSSFPFLLIFSVPALLLSLLQYLIPYPNHHLPLLFPFSPFFFSSSPLISPLFFSSSNHSYPSFSFLPALIISSSLLRYPISPFLSSASLIVPSIALFLSPSYLVSFIAFPFSYALILCPFPFLLASVLCFPYLAFTSSYFLVYILSHSLVIAPLFSLFLACLPSLALPPHGATSAVTWNRAQRISPEWVLVSLQ